MLFKNTVKPKTYTLLKQLMQIPELSGFVLVGGTNLSLRFGHRISIDLDLFTNIEFDKELIIRTLINNYPNLIKLSETNQSLFLVINDVKIDIILHKYPYINSIEIIYGIRLLSINDLIPMKLEAMATRSAKKYFWDINEILSHISLDKMLDFYQKKYKNNDLGHILLSMTYFEDAEIEVDPDDLHDKTWIEIKENLKNTVSIFLKNQIKKTNL